MQIIWLKAFIAVAELGNFYDAANEIYVSQSSLSKYIQMIEKQISVQLFDRSRRKIVLTPAGEKFYTYAEDIVEKYDEMLSAMEEFVAGTSDQVRVVTVSAPHIYGFSFVFYRFSKEHPEIDFSLQEKEMCEAMQALKNGEADFAVVRTNLVPELEQYNEIRFNHEKMYLMCDPSHPLGELDEVSLSDILNEKLVLQKFAVDELQLLFKKHHLPVNNMKIQLVSTRGSMMLEYIKNGLGVSIVSAGLAKHLDPYSSLSLIPIRERPEMTLGMLYPRGDISPACRKFAEHMQKMVTERAVDFSGPVLFPADN